MWDEFAAAWLFALVGVFLLAGIWRRAEKLPHGGLLLLLTWSVVMIAAALAQYRMVAYAA